MADGEQPLLGPLARSSYGSLNRPRQRPRSYSVGVAPREDSLEFWSKVAHRLSPKKAPPPLELLRARSKLRSSSDLRPRNIGTLAPSRAGNLRSPSQQQPPTPPLTPSASPNTMALLAAEAKRPRCTKLDVAMSVGKLVAGVGSYALPKAFCGAGWVGGLIGMPVIAATCLYCLRLLLHCRDKAHGGGAGGSGDADGLAPECSSPAAADCAPVPNARYAHSYADTMRVCLGPRTAAVLPVLSFFAAFGACAGYIDFMVPLLAESVLGDYSSSSSSSSGGGGGGGGSPQPAALEQSTRLAVTLCAAPVFIILCWIRSFRYLAWTSVVGDVAFVVAQLTVYSDGLARNGLAAAHGVPGSGGPLVALSPPGSPGFGDFVGAAVFLYGISLFVLPMQAAMARPEEFGDAVGMAFGATLGVNMGVGLLGYAIWGAGVQAIVIENMAPSWYKTGVRLLLVLDMTVSFPIVITPAREMLEERLSDACALRTLLPDGTPGGGALGLGDAGASLGACFLGGAREWRRNAIRTALVAVVFTFAFAVPDFLSVISLVSGVSLVSTALCFPLLCYLKTEWAALGAASRAGHSLLLLVATLTGLFTTWNALQALLGGIVQG
jgi:amino acid permease